MNPTPTMNRNLFRQITTLKAYGTSWELIAIKVQRPPEELERLPWRFKTQWLIYSAYADELVRREALAKTIATLQTSLLDAEPREQASIANSLARLLAMQQTKPSMAVPIPHTKKHKRREPQAPSKIYIQRKQPQTPVPIPEVNDLDPDDTLIEAELAQAEKHIQHAAQRCTEQANVEATHTPRAPNPILQILKQFNNKVAPLSKSAFAVLLMCGLFMTGTNATATADTASRRVAATSTDPKDARWLRTNANATSCRVYVTERGKQSYRASHRLPAQKTHKAKRRECG